eukprot:SAG31_NODE_2702_length_5221_cov_1.495705_4_plen_161_part_00
MATGQRGARWSFEADDAEIIFLVHVPSTSKSSWVGWVCNHVRLNLPALGRLAVHGNVSRTQVGAQRTKRGGWRQASAAPWSRPQHRADWKSPAGTTAVPRTIVRVSRSPAILCRVSISTDWRRLRPSPVARRPRFSETCIDTIVQPYMYTLQFYCLYVDR